MATDQPEISEAERKRLERFERTIRNRRGRKQPSILPTDLARTSAFVPRRQGLIDDKNFRRVYTVTNQSVVEVTGRELGSQHRDALYALFRLRARRIEIPNPAAATRALPASGRSLKSVDIVYETRGTWRDLLRLMGRSEHVNNLGTLLRVLEEIREVTFRVYQGTYADYLKATVAGKLPSAGFSDNLLNVIEWDGVNLSSQVLIRYGEWVKRMFEIKHLISLNSDVYFGLKSDYAKSFWPYIDSQPSHTWIDETILADLAGRDITTGGRPNSCVTSRQIGQPRGSRASMSRSKRPYGLTCSHIRGVRAPRSRASSRPVQAGCSRICWSISVLM